MIFCITTEFFASNGADLMLLDSFKQVTTPFTYRVKQVDTI